ncbi:MAG: hypothetical protein Q9222_001381 [Ikaeria aurantiellina]
MAARSLRLLVFRTDLTPHDPSVAEADTDRHSDLAAKLNSHFFDLPQPKGVTAMTAKAEPSASERIAQLNELDKDVAKLLHSAGLAIKTLTPAQLEGDEGQNIQTSSIEQRKASFVATSSQYFSLLSSIDVRLRRHIAALEDADIIPAEAATRDRTINSDPSTGSTTTSNLPLSRQGMGNRDAVLNGGLGNLDVGWLNSRNNNVEKEMEAELWEEAHKMVRNELKARENLADDEDVAMSSDPAPT